MDCAICCERTNRTTRAPVQCPFCAANQCVACVKKFLLGSSEDAQCMSCRSPWLNDFVDAVLPASFRNGELRRHREQVLMERERAMMPATQAVVERIYKARRMNAKIAELRRQRSELAERIWEAHMRLLRLQNGEDVSEEPTPDAPDQPRQFIKHCPRDGCRGFLSTAYRCGLCETRVCPACLEPTVGGGDGNDAAHVCRPEDVESVRAIRRDSRPCPACGCMIYRIDGCAQMFCTAPGCHTAFNWNTGRVVSGPIHNPHYLEYLRQNGERRGTAPGRNLDDIPCGGMPDARALLEVVDPRRVTQRRSHRANTHGVVVKPEHFRLLFQAHRLAQQVLDEEMPLRAPPPDRPDANQDLRVSFMMNAITEDELKTQLQRREKRRNKRAEIHQVLSTFFNVCADIFRTLVIERATPEAIARAVEDLEHIRVYINGSMRAIGKRFNCLVPNVVEEWHILEVRHDADAR